MKNQHPFTLIQKQLNMTTNEFCSFIGLSRGAFCNMTAFNNKTTWGHNCKIASIFDIDKNELWEKINNAWNEKALELKMKAEGKYKEALKNGHVIKL